MKTALTTLAAFLIAASAFAQAQRTETILKEWEREDREEGEFIPNFYELVEMEFKNGEWVINFTETYEGVL